VGIGRIYEQYKSGALVSDDEVALLFDPETLEPLSEPLVNIRYNLELAEERGILNKEVKEEILRVAQSLYYPERDYEWIISTAEAKLKVDLGQLKQFLSEERRDLKREDAIAALKLIKELI
jgi:hypothetical protein